MTTKTNSILKIKHGSVTTSGGAHKTSIDLSYYALIATHQVIYLHCYLIRNVNIPKRLPTITTSNPLLSPLTTGVGSSPAAGSSNSSSADEIASVLKVSVLEKVNNYSA